MFRKHAVLKTIGVIATLYLSAANSSAQVVQLAESHSENIYHVGGAGGASPPKCKVEEPDYTDDARQAHIQGTVELTAISHADGSITVTKVIQGLGHGLDEESEKALNKSKCIPGEVNGRPVAVQLKIVISFHLH